MNDWDEIEELEIGWVASFFRATGVFLAWLLGPLACLFALAYVGCWAAMVPLLLVFSTVYPHLSFMRESDHGFEAVFTGNGAIIAAIVQWAIATVLFGLITFRLVLKLQICLAPVFIVTVTVLIHIVFFLMGIEAHVEWP